MRKIISFTVVLTLCILVPLVDANYTGLPDFDWPHYWDAHKDDQNVACGHVALANALYYWDQKFPNLIPDSYGTPESMNFTAENGSTYNIMSFWNLMNALTAGQYLGTGNVDPSDMERGIPEWFKDRGVGLSFHTTKGMEITAEWDFLKKMIDKGEVPLIQIYVKDETEGNYLHWVTGTGYNDDTSFSVRDPNAIGSNTQTYSITEKDDGWWFTYNDGNSARIQSIQAVTATPEPSTVLLLSSGLFGLIALGKRKLSKRV